jgi:hypothetical protein
MLMARPPHLWKPGSFRKLKPGDVGYVSKTATKFRVLRGKDAGAIIYNAEKIKRVSGLHPTKLSEARKAGLRGYKSAASEQQAKTQSETRKGKWVRPEQVHGTHPFLNKAGGEQRASLNSRNLAITQTYREDVHGRVDRYGVTTRPGALETGDDSALKKYDRTRIYDVDGNRIYPETNVNKLRRWWNGKSIRQRNDFERELFYLTQQRRQAA